VLSVKYDVFCEIILQQSIVAKIIAQPTKQLICGKTTYLAGSDTYPDAFFYSH